MTFQNALDSDELEYIRSDHVAAEYSITFCKNTVVLHGQNNDDLSIPTSWVSFNYTSISGDWNDVEINQVLLIGVVDDIEQATFRGRVRSDQNVPAGITADVLYCNQSSDDFFDGAYFWVIDSYDITNKLSYPSSQDPDTAVELLDYNHTYTMLKPAIIGLQTAYVDDVDPITGKITLVIDVSSSFPTQVGTTGVLDYLWEIANATYIIGSDTDPQITVEITEGEQWATLTATDSLGSFRRRKFYIMAHSVSDPPFDYSGSVEISSNMGEGWTATIDVMNDVDSILTETFTVIRRKIVIPEGFLRSNVAFVGWFTKETDSSTGDESLRIDAKATFNIVGVAGRLAAIESQETPMTMVDTPSENGQIKNLTPQRAMLHYLDEYTTVGETCDIDFDDFSDDWLFPIIPTQGDIAKAAMDSIAHQWTAILEFAPWGAMCIALNLIYLGATARSNLPTIIVYTKDDILMPGGISKDKDLIPDTGKVDCVGAVYSPNTQLVRDYESRSPGHARGESSGSGTLPNQILKSTNNTPDALLELRQRGADYYEDVNLQEYLDIDHPLSYTFIIPSKSEKYGFNISLIVLTDRGVNRISYDSSIIWTNESISYSISFIEGAGSEISVKGRYKRIADVGSPGDDTTLVAPGEEQPSNPDLGMPAFDWELPEVTIPDEGLTPDKLSASSLLPPAGKIATFKGQELLIWDDDAVAYLWNFINLTTPNNRIITPATILGIVEQGVVDPFFTNTAIPGYLLESDGTDTLVSWNPNIASPNANVGWVDGVSIQDEVGINGEFTVARGVMVNGGILIYSPDSGIEPPPPPSNCIAAADFNRYAQIVAGTLVAGGDTSAVALSSLGGVPGDYPGSVNPTVHHSVARYTFTNPVTIVSATMSIKCPDTHVLAGTYYDSGGSILWQFFFPQGGSSSGYPAWSGGYDIFQHVPLANVKKVEVSLATVNSNPENLLSDVEICYT